MSFGDPMRLSGWRSAAALRFSSLESKFAASGVSVNEGAITFTRIRGANSAANDLASPSTAPLAPAMDA